MMGAAVSGSYQGMEATGSRRSAAAATSSFSMRLRFPCFRKNIPERGALPVAGDAGRSRPRRAEGRDLPLDLAHDHALVAQHLADPGLDQEFGDRALARPGDAGEQHRPCRPRTSPAAWAKMPLRPEKNTSAATGRGDRPTAGWSPAWPFLSLGPAGQYRATRLAPGLKRAIQSGFSPQGGARRMKKFLPSR